MHTRTWVLDQCRKRARRQLLAISSLFFLFVALVVYLQWGYIENCLHGPYDVDLAAVEEAALAGHYYVRVHGGTTVSAPRWGESARVQTDGEHRLLVSSRNPIVDAEPFSLTGTLKPFLGEGKRAGAVYSFILDVDDDFFLSFLGLGLFVLVCGVGVIFKSVPVIRHWLKPESHPTIERIRQRGDDLKRTSTRVQEELQSPIVKTWRWTATQTYLVKSTVFSFDVSRFDELVWGCKQAVKRRDWILPFGALYEARLAFPSHSLFLPARERQVDAVLAHAVNVTPWAMHGPARQVQLLYDQKVVTEPAENSWGRVSHDIKAEIYLTAEEAAAGVRRMVTCHYLIPCPQCHQPDRESCYLCRGSGAAVIAAPYTFDVPAGAGRGSGMVLAGDGIPKTPYAEAGTLRIWFLIE